MRKLISYCLYGNRRMYCIGALYNAWQVQQGQYPGWTAEFGVDGSAPAPVVDALRGLGASVVDYSGYAFDGNARMLWRWLPLVDKRCDVMISRDCDSALYSCDWSTVEFWLSDVRTLSMTIRNSQSHGSVLSGPGYMGGMCGFRWHPMWRGLLASLKQYALRKIDPAGCGVDQAWLSYVVYPALKDSYAEFGGGSEGACQHPIIGAPGPVHIGAPGGPEGDHPLLPEWEKVCEGCV